MKVNELNPEIKLFLYKRFYEQQDASDIDYSSMEMSIFRNDLDYQAAIFPKAMKYDYYKYAPNIQECLDKARKITEHHWNIKIEWQ